MYRISIWTIVGALTGLAFAILGLMPPTFPSKFWDPFYQIASVAMKPALFAYRLWVQWVPLPDGQYASLPRYYLVNIVQWLQLGFLIGVGAHLSVVRRKRAREEQFKKNHDNLA